MRRNASATPPDPICSSSFFCTFSYRPARRLYLISHESFMNSISFLRLVIRRSLPRIMISYSRSFSSHCSRACWNWLFTAVSSSEICAFCVSLLSISIRRSLMRTSDRSRKSSNLFSIAGMRSRCASASSSSSSSRRRISRSSSSRSARRWRSSSSCSPFRSTMFVSSFLIVASRCATRSRSCMICPSANFSCAQTLPYPSSFSWIRRSHSLSISSAAFASSTILCCNLRMIAIFSLSSPSFLLIMIWHFSVTSSSFISISCILLAGAFSFISFSRSSLSLLSA
mmetsp:Transcript_98224/g.254021  ORF Transcript_98224/g.254021 Transcript_98224/m.254021 type:complete len:284 (+) Transcript_98224:1310-2161(+)